MPKGLRSPLNMHPEHLVWQKEIIRLEKEGLAIVSEIKRFNLYLYGRKFTLFIDHYPLTRIFGPKSGFPSLAAARLQS